MPISKVTSKGQVTIPVEIRQALGIEQGDDLLFEVTPEQFARVRVLKRQRLSDLYGALPATRPFPGTAAIREQTGLELGKKDERS